MNKKKAGLTGALLVALALSAALLLEWFWRTSKGRQILIRIYENGHGLNIPVHVKIVGWEHVYAEEWIVQWVWPLSLKDERPAKKQVTCYTPRQVTMWRFAVRKLEALYESTINGIRSIK